MKLNVVDINVFYSTFTNVFFYFVTFFNVFNVSYIFERFTYMLYTQQMEFGLCWTEAYVRTMQRACRPGTIL